MTESALYSYRMSVEQRLASIISRESAAAMMITLQLVLAKFMISETKKLNQCIKAKDVYFGSPEYGLCCELIARLSTIAEAPSFMEWYRNEHKLEVEGEVDWGGEFDN